MPLMTEIPENWREPAARMVTSLRGLDRVLVAAHVNPDGDALGSMSALGWLLKDMGKEFVLYSPSGVPDYLSFLPLPCTLLTSLERLPFEPQALVLLDCGEPHRLGDDLAAALEGRFAGTAIVNIDHHLGSDGMGTVDNWIEPAAAATAQLAAYVCLAAGLRPEGPLGESLALGLVTDTGGFLHGSTTAAVFRLAALLSDSGCDIHKLREKLDNNWSPARMALWARLMQRVEISCDGRAPVWKTCASAGPSRKIWKGWWSSSAACAAWRPPASCGRTRPASTSSACVPRAPRTCVPWPCSSVAAATATPRAGRCAWKARKPSTPSVRPCAACCGADPASRENGKGPRSRSLFLCGYGCVPC